MNKIPSKYFDFNTSEKFQDKYISEYTGWNSLLIAKIEIKKGLSFNDNFINSKYSDLKEKQKIFVIIKGSVKTKYLSSNLLLKEFDAIDFISSQQTYEMQSLEDSILFMISAKNLESQSGKPVFFNLIKDIKSKNLWGGQIISRPYEGPGLTLVLFDLKPGFKFEDKGHPNEQITWLISGKMDFYANGKHKTLNSKVGVDIGPNHLHGGVSGGAVGFDAFFPKREEKKYKN